jgi:signal transduction histidine kinase
MGGENQAAERPVSMSMARNPFNSNRRRNILVFGLILAFLAISILFHFYLGINIAYSHFAYVPIFLSSIWWGRKAVIVPIFLGIWIIALELLDRSTLPIWPGLARVGMFLAVGLLVGELNHRHRAAQAELHDANIQLRRLSKLHRDFLHIAIHDLQSPVGAASALLTGLSTLAGDRMSPREKHLLVRAQARMLEVTSFLRDFQLLSSFDSSQLRNQAVRVDVGRLVRQVADENQGQISGKEHTVILEVSDTAPLVAAIPILVKEAITNYLTNAVKYTPQGGRIVLRFIDLGDRVRVDVEDNGIGIAPEDQEKLFQEFSRVRREHREGEIKIPGIGLGLSIAKRIVEMHGGRVFLDSEPGRGSVFSFEIPACEPGEGPVTLPEIRD